MTTTAARIAMGMLVCARHDPIGAPPATRRKVPDCTPCQAERATTTANFAISHPERNQ